VVEDLAQVVEHRPGRLLQAVDLLDHVVLSSLVELEVLHVDDHQCQDLRDGVVQLPCQLSLDLALRPPGEILQPPITPRRVAAGHGAVELSELCRERQARVASSTMQRAPRPPLAGRNLTPWESRALKRYGS